MKYEDYIASKHWQTKRKERLEIDGHRCCFCNRTAQEVSDKRKTLDVHHKTYERFGDELMSDLASFCPECHDIITNATRHRRYAKRRKKNKISLVAKAARIKPNGLDRTNLRIDRVERVNNAQRPIGFTYESVVKSDKAD